MEMKEILERMHGQKLYFCNDETLMKEQAACLEILYDFNQTRPGEGEKRTALLRQLLAEVGENVYIEPPLRANWGRHTHIGRDVYANFNLTLVDDTHIYIGEGTMIGPNVTIDAAILCLKAGDAVILRGGSEAIRSNLALAGLLHEALESAGLPADAVQVVETTDRAAVAALCKLDKYVDVMIPRGGESLVRAVCEAATMPVLKHYMGVCHLYVDEGADLGMALRLARNGKVQRPGVCNALECLLVHQSEAEAFLPKLGETLGGDGVTFRACPRALPLLRSDRAVPAQPGDFGQEFHDLILAVRVVDSLDEALDHIARYGSNHTEVICTNNHANATRFLREADASLTAVNASTRFNDGGQLGLGAEIGISTSKLHSYGAMGVRELTTTKFVALGTGQIRE